MEEIKSGYSIQLNSENAETYLEKVFETPPYEYKDIHYFHWVIKSFFIFYSGNLDVEFIFKWMAIKHSYQVRPEVLAIVGKLGSFQIDVMNGSLIIKEEYDDDIISLSIIEYKQGNQSFFKKDCVKFNKFIADMFFKQQLNRIELDRIGHLNIETLEKIKKLISSGNFLLAQKLYESQDT